MRDIVVFVTIIASLPLCFLRPWVGLCAFSWLAYNRTQDLTWGFARTLPFSQLIAIAMILGWLLVDFRPLPMRYARMKAMALLVVVIGVSLVLNPISWELQGHRYLDLAKVIFVAILTGAMLDGRHRLRVMMAIIACALGFYGAKNGIGYTLFGAESITGPGGMLKDNNDFSLAMTMNLPLLYYLADDMAPLRYGRWIRLFMKTAFWLTFLTIVSTGSRGAFLATAVTVTFMAWKTKYKIPAMAAIALGGVLGLAFAPAEYTERIASIFATGEERDESAKGRLTSWLVALNMIEANPVFGIGFNRMVKEYNNYTEGVPNEEGSTEHYARVAHNSYLQIWAESGSIAYVLFMFVLLGSIIMLEVQVRRFKRRGETWAVPYGNAIQVSMTAFFVGATFLNRAHFDLIYQLVAIATCLPAIVAMERRPRRTDRRGRRLAEHVAVGHRDVFARTPLPPAPVR